MKKRLLKSTFIVATFLLTSIVSSITYKYGKIAPLSDVDLLMVENLFAFADNQDVESKPVMGPVLKITHHDLTLVDHVNTLEAYLDLHEIYKDDSYYADQKYNEVCGIVNLTPKEAVPEEYHKYVSFKDEDKYYKGERQENVLNGKYAECTNIGLTTLPSSGRPIAKTYYTKEEFDAEF